MEYRNFPSLECRNLVESFISDTSCEPSVVQYKGDEISLQVHYRNCIHLKCGDGFINFTMAIDAAPLSLACFFATSWQIEGSVGIISG